MRVYGLLGRGEKELLVVDTSQPPQAKIVSERTTVPVENTSSSTSEAVDGQEGTGKTHETPSPTDDIESDISEGSASRSPSASVPPFSHSRNASQPQMTEQGTPVQELVGDDKTLSENHVMDLGAADT